MIEALLTLLFFAVLAVVHRLDGVLRELKNINARGGGW